MNRSIWRGLLAVALLVFSSAAFAAGYSKTYERIRSWDGTPLGALVLVPQGRAMARSR